MSVKCEGRLTGIDSLPEGLLLQIFESFQAILLPHLLRGVNDILWELKRGVSTI